MEDENPLKDLKYFIDITAESSFGFRVRTPYPRNHFTIVLALTFIFGENICRFLLSHVLRYVLMVNRETFNHIEQRSIKNAFVLEARVRNEALH